ncbi:hypothetical protein DH2020_009656 [Rehmannia glutinosa]|uniref:3-oxo-5-alpha-steroid 4-dehydrogenase C-terminal domain-containing protein n=1 Tax=Rehmannia glutinosa TaxID=99300 RepID=A0ABR0X6Z1_REHGL
MINQALPMVLVSLLRAVWIAGTLPIVIASIPSSKVDAFRELLLKLSRRGKVMESSSKKLSVPQKFFCHFYILAVTWTSFLLVATWLYAYKTAPTVSEPVLYSSIASHLTGISHEFSLRKSHSSLNYTYGIWKSVFLLLLMETQVLRRLFESIYVFKYSPSARMHIAGYLTGLIFYTAAPLSLCCTYVLDVFEFVANIFVEFVVKGKDRMQVIEFDLWGLVNPFIQLKWYVWIGAAFFFWGWIHQQRCHAILGLFKENDQKVNDYAIPHGDWFKYVSSPHYLAEIVIYGGLVIASGFSDITIWLLFGFVVTNLAFAAAETQRWYLRKFDNYPRNRCAIIPFVY